MSSRNIFVLADYETPIPRIPSIRVDIQAAATAFMDAPCRVCGRARRDCASDPCPDVLEATAKGLLEDLT